MPALFTATTASGGHLESNKWVAHITPYIPHPSVVHSSKTKAIWARYAKESSASSVAVTALQIEMTAMPNPSNCMSRTASQRFVFMDYSPGA